MSDITQFQSLLGGSNWRLNHPMYFKSDGIPRTNFAARFTPQNAAQNITTAKPELVLDPTTGTMVGKNRPTGFGRALAGLQDIFTGGDADQLGHGGGRMSAEGYGGPGENYKVKVGGGTEEKASKIDDFKQATGMTLNEYIAEMEGVQDRAASKKFARETAAKMPDIAHAAFGGSYATSLGAGTKGITAAATATSGMRPYQFSAQQLPGLMNFASLLG